MNYNESLKYIEETHKFGIRLGLDNMKNLLELLGNPQDKLNIIHVAGTNGKGSTCSFISSILKESGYKVGLYTSPFLETFTERIRVNGENISQEDVARIVNLIKEKTEESGIHPTEFEIVTAMAFLYYYEQDVDFVALEVGLGGRFDATNIINKSEVSVITSISLDHVGILGDTVENIAYEKGGIIKENGTVIMYDQDEKIKNVIKDICKEKNAKYIEVKFNDIDIKQSDIYSQKYDCSVLGKSYENLEIKLIGEHQINNSILALATIQTLKEDKGLNMTQDAIRKGLIETRWPGRIEKIMDEPIFIIDGAHNEDGAKSLAKSIQKNFNGKKLTLLIGMLEDKDIDSVLSILMPYFSKVITTTPDNPRAIDCNILKDKISKYVDNIVAKESIEDAVKYSLENTKEDEIIISAGSLYMIGTVRTIVNKEK